MINQTNVLSCFHDQEAVGHKMMSKEDKDLLERNRPELMEHIDLEGSVLLAELRKRRALSLLQEQIIKEVMFVYDVFAVISL